MTASQAKQTPRKRSSLAPWNEREERLWAQLAVALTRPNQVGSCLEDETLAAFHEGRLSDVEERAVREHVAACDSCYERWLEARDWVPKPAFWSIFIWRKDFWQGRPAWRRLGWFAATGAVAAACLLLTFTLLLKSPPGLVLDEWTATELRGLVSIAPGGVVPPPPSAATPSPRIRGFSVHDFPLTGEDLAAFISGIRLAATTLAATEPSWGEVRDRIPDQAASDPGRELLTALGYWSTLVAVACDTAVAEDKGALPRYLEERHKQLEWLWSQARQSALPAAVKNTLAAWVQEAAASQGRDLCRLPPVLLARELVSSTR